MTPTITDDDKGTITATVDGKVVRSWTYFSDGKYRQRDTMAKAREYAEGWHNAEAVRPDLNRDELLHIHRALLAYGQRSNRSAEEHAQHLIIVSKIADTIRATNPNSKAPP